MKQGQIDSTILKKKNSIFSSVFHFYPYICTDKTNKTNNQIYTIMAYIIVKDECQACGTCKDECPQEAIMEGDVYSIDPEKCVECGACADVCPCGAIKPE